MAMPSAGFISSIIGKPTRARWICASVFSPARQNSPARRPPPAPTKSSRAWKSVVGDDKRNVHVIECQPIGGLKLFRQSNCDLEPAHGDDEFISQILRINRANINAWPELRYFSRHSVREFP